MTMTYPRGEGSAAAGRPVSRALGELRIATASLLRQPGLLLASIVLATVLSAALFPQIFTPLNPLRGSGAARLLAPSAAHWFGTDQLGRDLLTRVVYGTGESVKAVAVAVMVGLVLGSVIGLLAGYVGRWVDDILMRVMDVLLAVPTLLISLAIINALGFGTFNIAIAVGIGSVASFARVMRSEVLKVRQMPYVEAASFAGIGPLRTLIRHVLPNAAGPVLVLATLELGMAILSVSALSFLGFGAPPPAPEWGLLVAGGRDYMATAWWLTTLPGLVIAITVLSANRVARALDRRHAATF
ncbi:ABC transporter permease [Ancylobacter sp. Lp-2]|uniref:ABC transporter permease n=1 Tax=Ancylobacter sp. Lp-2 TaxID=2881339 RepID=UPI001E3BC1F6|nr:ABC transporter permease [Ancylobacter sp. Lp-2]MCB4770442.1 ABC transporter permease [Ancylobacter sp. Lp-2]